MTWELKAIKMLNSDECETSRRMSACATFSTFAFLRILLYCGVLVAFSPLYFGVPSKIEDTSLSKAIGDTDSTSLFRDSCIVIVALLAPVMGDMSVDIVNYLMKLSFRKLKQTSCTGQGSSMKYTTSIPQGANKISMIFGIILVPLVTFLPDHISNIALIYLCCERASQLIIVVECLISFMQYDSSAWPRKIFIPICITFVIGQVLSIFAINELGDSGGEHLPVSLIVSFALVYSPLVITAYYVLSWIKSTYVRALKKYLYGEDDSSHEAAETGFAANKIACDEMRRVSVATNKEKHQQDYIFLQVIYVASHLTNLSFILVVGAYYWRVYDIDQTGLFLRNLAVILFQLAFLVLSTRSLKFDAAHALVSTIQRNQ
jgi:hypothetical protein